MLFEACLKCGLLLQPGGVPVIWQGGICPSFLPKVPSLWGFLTVAPESEAVPGQGDYGDCPSESVLSKGSRAGHRLGSPGPCLAEVPIIPTDLSDSWGFFLHSAAPGSELGPWRDSRVLHCHPQRMKMVVALVLKSQRRGFQHSP